VLTAFLIFAQKLIIPEIMDYVRNRQAATGKIPTTEEVQANFLKEVMGGIEKGTAYLDTHPVLPA
jgi:DNA-directed RNA polymerase specialized sigma subunit